MENLIIKFLNIFFKTTGILIGQSTKTFADLTKKVLFAFINKIEHFEKKTLSVKSRERVIEINKKPSLSRKKIINKRINHNPEPEKKKPFPLDLNPSRIVVDPKPVLDIFEKQPKNTSEDVGSKKDIIIEAFASFGVEIEIGNITCSPSVEQYESLPKKGVRLNNIIKPDKDISIALKSNAAIAPTSKGSLCIIIPLKKRQNVFFSHLLETSRKNNQKIHILAGVDIVFRTIEFNLAELPHLLIAGTKGSEKSILVKIIIVSIMYNYTPDDIKLVLIDPKRVEFRIFNSSPFLSCKTITKVERSVLLFKEPVNKMERRYSVLEAHHVSNINQYNRKYDKTVKRHMP